MIKVSLLSKTNEEPINLISHAAKVCYSSKVPEMGNTLDVDNILFKTGHHTTLQHSYFTFNINGPSISSISFGLHLTHPFYNSDQRSGRYSKMYNKPNFDEIKEYILKYWNNVNNIDEIIDFIKLGIDIYTNNIERAAEIAKRLLKEERPFINDELLEKQAPKIAQEQLRTFISTIFPTGLDMTLNLSAITALWRSAWNPEMIDITNQMKDLVLKEYPNLEFMFNDKMRRNDYWAPEINSSQCNILKEPQLDSLNILINKDEINLNDKSKDSVNVKYFTPENMGNNVNYLSYNVEVSIATFSQDQRHRTIKRGIPSLTGNFYLPPILQEMNLEKVATDYIKKYFNVIKNIDKTLSIALAPYGLMVKYKKFGDINSILHEQEKRLCWTAQEEIYNVSRKLHDKLLENGEDTLVESFCPSCYKKGCIEGPRYCGRDVSKIKSNKKLMPIRKV